MSRLAILIPYLGDTAALEDTLSSVLANRPADSQIVVVACRPYADPYAVGGEVRFVDAAGARNIAAALQIGLAETAAPIVHTLACGTTVCDGWTDAALAHFHNRAVGCVAPLLLDADEPTTVLAAGVAYHDGGDVRPLARGKPAESIAPKPKKVTAPHALAAFWHRSALESVDLKPAECNDRLWSIDLALGLRQLGLFAVLEPRCQVWTSSRRAFPAGKALCAMDAERLFWRWAPASGWARSLALHAVELIAEGIRGIFDLGIVARTTGRTLGGLLGVMQPGRRRHVERLLALRNPPSHAETSDDAEAEPAVVPTVRWKGAASARAATENDRESPTSPQSSAKRRPPMRRSA